LRTFLRRCKRILIVPSSYRSSLRNMSFVMRLGDRLLLRLMIRATPLARGNEASGVNEKTYVMF